MVRVYIISTLKNEWNLIFNPRLCAALENEGVSVYLPQRDTNQSGGSLEKYEKNMRGMQQSQKIVAVALNETINWGAEVGFCYGTGKPVIALTSNDHELPVMTLGMYAAVFRCANLDALDYVAEFANLLKA